MSRIEGLRLVAGFVFAPAIGVLVLVLALIAKEAFAPVGGESFEFLGFVLGFGMAAAYVAYLVTFIVALPLFILFRIKGWLRLWQIAAGGLLIGALMLIPPGDVVFGLMSCAVGVSTGLAFWIIAIFRNRALTPGSRTDALTAARG